jgi:hypothetical protein
VLVQALLVPPGDPLEGGLFQGVHGFERVEVDWVLFPVFYWVTGVTCD